MANKKVPTNEEVLSAYGIELQNEAVISALSNSNPEVREKAALLLGNKKEIKALHDLQKLLSDNYVYARLAAAFALAKLGEHSGIEVLKNALNDNDVYILAYANSRLIDLSDQSGYEVLLKTLNSSTVAGERIQALSEIGKFKDLIKDEVIINLLDKVLLVDKDDSVRRVAASELKNYSGEKVQNIFKRLLNEKDIVIQGLAKKYSMMP